MDRFAALLQKRDHKRTNFENALEEFESFCDQEISRPIEVAGLIQGFEFTFELAWKLLNVLCSIKGVEVAGPRDTLKAAFSLALISNEKVWLAMLEDRNKTTHRYDQEFVTQLIQHLKTDYRKQFTNLREVARI